MPCLHSHLASTLSPHHRTRLATSGPRPKLARKPTIYPALENWHDGEVNDYLQPQISPIVPTEVLDAPEGENPIADGTEDAEMIAEPGKVMRIGSMVKQLLDEVRQAPLDEAGRDRLRQIYETSLSELSDGLSPDLAAELRRVSIDFGPEIPSEAELRIAQAQLVGWLEGLFHGIQAALMAQQITARAQFEESRLRELPDPSSQGDGPRPGTYL